MGAIMAHKVFGRCRYFHASANNYSLLTSPTHITGLEDLRALQDLADAHGWTNHVASLIVFRLGRIFRLERSALFMAEFRARLELGAINFHLRPCMFTWAKIGSPFEATILALYSKVSSYHLTSTEFLITT